MKEKTKKIISNTIWYCLTWLLLMTAFTYLWYSFGFNSHHSVLLAILLTVYTQILLEMSGYLKEIVNQRKDIVECLNKISEHLNEMKETDEHLSDELEKINSRAKLEDARKALNS